MTAGEELERIRTRRRILGTALRGAAAWEILLELAAAGRPLKTSCVGASTNIRPTTALRYIDTLEEAGLVRRSVTEADDRVVLISLSAEGRETVERCLA